MGIGPQIISIYSDLFNRIDFSSDFQKSVCELGRQNLTIYKNIDDIFLQLFKSFKKEPNKEAMKLAPKDNWGIRAKILYESLGFSYFSIDIDHDENNEDTSSNLVMDFNFDNLDKIYFNKFNLVTNFGTSEHLINQLNFFKIMHQLTKVDGYMIHEVPCMFGVNHGMFKYEPKFFTDLARSNAYEVIDLKLVADPPSLKIYNWDKTNYQAQCNDMCILVILKKTNDQEFCIPICGNYEMKIKDEVMKRYKYNFEGSVISGDKTKQILRADNSIKHLKKEILIKELVNRLLSKFKI